MRPPIRAAGFTLLETLVALAVLGMLVAGLTQGLHLGLRIWRGQIAGLAATADLDATNRILRTLIARMDTGGVSGQPPIFIPTPRSLTFRSTLPEPVAPNPAPAGATPIPPIHDALITIAVDDAHRLELRFVPNYRNPTRLVPPIHATLALNVDHLEMGYWDDATTAWRTQWTAPDAPRLIRLRIVFPPGDPRHGPDIVVRTARDRWRL